MGFIDNNLMPQEHVVYRTRLHWIIFLGPVIFTVLGLALSIEGDRSGPIGFPFFVISLFWGISSFIKMVTSEFGITNKRVLIKVGFIRRESVDTLLAKVEGIHIHQGILGRILNYGTIVIRGTGGSSTPFKKIRDPLEFRQKVQEQISLSVR